MENEKVISAIMNVLTNLHYDSWTSIDRTIDIANDYRETDPEGSNNLLKVAKGQTQSHTLIDRAIFEIEQIIKNNVRS